MKQNRSLQATSWLSRDAERIRDGLDDDRDGRVDGVGVCAGALPIVAPRKLLLLACLVATTGLLALTLRERSFSRPRS